MNRQGFAPVILLLVLGALVVGVTAWYFGVRSQQAVVSTPQTATTDTATLSVDDQKSSVTSTWKSYYNSRYHYSFSYPTNVIIGSDIGGISSTQSEVIYLTLNPEGEPTFLCGGPNLNSWTSRQMLDHWEHANEIPLLPYLGNDKYEYRQCMLLDLDHPAVAGFESVESTTTIGGFPGYEITNTNKKYVAICDYVASPATLLATCSELQDTSNPQWQQNVNLYRRVLASIKIEE